MANISYIRVLQAIELFSKEHLQVKRFASDFPGQMPSFGTESEAYPIVYVSPTETIFNENTSTFQIDVYCFDVIQKDRENINTILSDTNLILSDLHRWLLDGDVYGLDIINTPVATPIDNALLDYVAGWRMTIILDCSTYGVCEIPFNETPVILTEINDVVYTTYLTCDTLDECDTFTDAIDNLQEQIDNLPSGNQDLQSVLDVGNTAIEREIILNDQPGFNSANYTNSGFYTSDTDNGQQNQVNYKSWYQTKGNGKGWKLDTEVGMEFTFNENNKPTKITNATSTQSIILNVPDKPEGEYTIATTADIIGSNPTLDEVLGNGNTTDKTAIFSDGTKTSIISPVSVFVGASNTDGTTINNNQITFRKWGGGSSADIEQKLILNENQNNSYLPFYRLPAKTQDSIFTLVTNDELNLNNVVMNGGNNTINTAIVNSSLVSGSGYSTFSPGSLNISNLGADYINIIPGAIIFKQPTGNSVRLISSTMSTANVIYRLPLKTTAGTYDLVTSETLGNYVPYTGATGNVNLGANGLTGSWIGLTGGTGVNVGRLSWNDTDGTVDLGLKGGNVTLQIGQESVIRVVNKTATNIDLLESNYQAVRITGAQGNRLKVDLAQATSDLLSAETIGLVTETIANNQEGFITTSGLIRGINTTGSLQSETWADGDILYLSPTVAGRITNIKPVAPNHLVIIGYVVRAHITQGQIFVKVDNGYELDELHNVLITGATGGDLLTYNGLTQVWENQTEEFRLRQSARVISSDFIGTVAAANTPFTFAAYNAGTQSTTTYLNGTNPGVVRIASSSTPNSGGVLSTNTLPTGNILPAIGQQMDFVFRTPNTIIGVGSTIRAGFILATNTATDATHGFYIEIVDNQLYGKTAASSSRSQTATSYSISNGGIWFHMRVLYKAADLIEYSLYNMAGALLWSDTLTTNIPTSLFGCSILAFSSASNTSNTEMVNMDYVGFTLPTSTRGALN